ncbi:hypothetical protein FIBSPDRAFT_666574, partial [Athelia psychrophila]
AQSIINPGADMNAEAGYASGLVVASRNTHIETVKLLVENGPHTDTEKGEMYGVALVAASSQGHLEIIELLILVAKGALLDTEGGMYGAALREASFQGHLEIVELLVKNGADLNTKG